MNQPKITVLMSVYNGEKYLGEAIESILVQTFRDFELVIIDDCSTDSSAGIFKSYDDFRIRVARNQDNLGLQKSLNIGLGLARGKYVARLDADDISMPERLEKQYACMENDPDLAVCASSYEIIDENGNAKRVVKGYLSSEELYYNLTFAQFLAHSAVFFRRDVILAMGGYNEELKMAGDYDLWHRVSRVAKVVHMREVLVKWREHTESISLTDKKGQTHVARSTAFKWIDQICDHRIDPDVIKVLCEWDEQLPFTGVNPRAVIKGVVLLNKRLIASAPGYVDKKKLRKICWQRVNHYVVIASRQRGFRSLLKTLCPILFSPSYAMLLGRSLAGSAYRRIRGIDAKS